MDWFDLQAHILKGGSLHTERQQGAVHPHDLTAELMGSADARGERTIFGATGDWQINCLEAVPGAMVDLVVPGSPKCKPWLWQASQNLLFEE